MSRYNRNVVNSMNHQCKIYFAFEGDFDAASVAREIGRVPDFLLQKGSKNAGGKIAPLSICRFDIDSGEIDDLYNVFSGFHNEFQHLGNGLKELREKYSATLRLQVVIRLYEDSKKSAPALGLSEELIAFLSLIGANFDVDIYNYPKSEI